MKNYIDRVKNFNMTWSMPILGLMTAYFWFTGTLTTPWWWLLFIPCCLGGYVNVRR